MQDKYNNIYIIAIVSYKLLITGQQTPYILKWRHC